MSRAHHDITNGIEHLHIAPESCVIVRGTARAAELHTDERQRGLVRRVIVMGVCPSIRDPVDVCLTGGTSQTMPFAQLRIDLRFE